MTRRGVYGPRLSVNRRVTCPCGEGLELVGTPAFLRRMVGTACAACGRVLVERASLQGGKAPFTFEEPST